MSFAVIGAGVVGLTTALELQKEFPSANVTIVAEKFRQDTTSDVAAGLFRPSPSFAGPTETITRNWINSSHGHWDNLRKSSNASLAGVTQVSSYIFSSTVEDIVRNRYLEDLLPVYRRATKDELTICPGDWKFGSFFTTLLVECRIYQPWATQKDINSDNIIQEINVDFLKNTVTVDIYPWFIDAGGRIVKQHVNSFSDIDTHYDVIVNCSGFGAKLLCNDSKLVPIRGQIMKVKAPWIKMAFFGDYDTYIFPGFNGIATLGGTRQYDSYNLKVDKYDSLSIRERCEQLVPSLRRAPVVREAVGLRPHRSTVRVEMELIQDANKKNMKVVHNYGHGGYGVSTSPGTAKHSVQFVKDFLSMSGSKL